jgi:hypothetical protein
MTVAELIEALKQMPKDAEVVVDSEVGEIEDYLEIAGVRREIPANDDPRVTLYCTNV